MNTNSNLAIAQQDNKSVVPISIVSVKEKFNKFYANYINASWDNRILAVANYLSLPVSICLLDKKLILIEGTEGRNAGHSTLYDFVTTNHGMNGIGQEWDTWRREIIALIQKLEFGINSSSAEDVLLQIDDVSAKLGRKPVSKFEFNLAKDQLLREQVTSIQKEHKQVVSVMRDKVTSLIGQLEDERKEKYKAIESLEFALSEVRMLKADSHSLDFENYVESTLYYKIVDELANIKSEHGEIIQSYLEKISKLSVTNKSQLSHIEKLSQLISLKNNQISDLSEGVKYNETSKLSAEIKSLKLQVIGLLKSNIHKQKVINKQKVISHQKTQINQLLRSQNVELRAQANIRRNLINQTKTVSRRYHSEPFFKSAWFVGIISFSTSAVLLSTLYLY